MAVYVTNTSELTSIANAIRTKGGTSANLEYPNEFISAINAISSSSNSIIISDTLDSAGGTIRTITTSDDPIMHQQKTNITPGATSVTVTPDTGYDAMTSVQINGDANLISSNIKNDVSIFGVTGNYVGSTNYPTFTLTVDAGTLVASSATCDKTYAECTGYYNNYGYFAHVDVVAEGQPIALGAVGSAFFNSTTNIISYYVEFTHRGVSDYQIDYASNGTITVTNTPIPLNDSTDLTASTLTVTAPAGYYDSNATKTLTDANLVAENIKDGITIFGVTGNYAGSSISLQAKTNINPTTSSQTITADNGYDGLSSVQINAMPTMTLPTSASSSATSGYTSKATISRSTSDQYINIPTGYNSAGAYYKINAVANGSATGPSSLSGSSATVSTGTNTITLTKTGVNTTPTVSAGYVSAATSSTATVTLTASVTTKGAATITPGTTNQTIASGTYLTGTQTISGDANLVAGNIISGKSIFGVSGSVVIQHYYTGSSTPSSSIGENGDIYLKTS